MWDKTVATAILLCTLIVGLLFSYSHSGGTVPPEMIDSCVNSSGVENKTAVAFVPDDTGERYVDPFDGVDVPAIVQSSDLIVVGRVEQYTSPNYLKIVHGLNSPSNRMCKLPISELKEALGSVITVDRVLKGKLPHASKSLKVRDLAWEASLKVDQQHGIRIIDDPKVKKGLPQLTYGILFLKVAAPRKYDFVDPDHVILPASPLRPSVEGLPPLPAVVNEIVNVLATPLATLTEKGGALGEETGCGSQGSYSICRGEVLCGNAVSVLKGVSKDIVGPPLRKIAINSSDLFSKVWAVNGLCSIGDFSFLKSIESTMLNPPPKLVYVSRAIVQNILHNIQCPTPALLAAPYPLPHVGSLLRSTDLEVRRASVAILSSVGNKEDVVALKLWGINDKDTVVREDSIKALARITSIGEDFWHKKPALASDLAKETDRLPPFSTSLFQGVTFDEQRFTGLLNSRLKAARGDWYRIPKWVGAVGSYQHQGMVPTKDAWWLAEESNSGLSRYWNRSGSGDQIWYEYRRAYQPQVSKGCFTQRCSTVCFALAPESCRFVRESCSDKLLAPAKIVDVWQQDDEKTYEKLSESSVRITSIRRIFGADGKPLKTAPVSGMEATADLNDANLESVDPRVIERSIYQGNLAQQLSTYLLLQGELKEFIEVQRGLAQLKTQITNLPPDSFDTLPVEQKGLPGGAMIHLPLSEEREQLKDLQLPRKGGMFAIYQNGLAGTLNACISLARSGNPNAEYGIGWIYLTGTEQTVSNPKLALHWLRKAAEHGNAAAQDDLGWIYEMGAYLPRDYTEALKWYRLASASGDAQADYDLAQMYEKGLGVKCDFNQAMVFYEKSYREKMDYSLFAALKLWASGRAKPSQNLSKGENSAFDFVMKYGTLYDQVHLAEVYDNGDGVSRDLDKAIALCTKASSTGDGWAKRNLADLQKKRWLCFW